MARAVVLFGLISLTIGLVAGDESSIISDFQTALQAADPKLAQEAYMREHTNPPTEEEIEKLVDSLCIAAVNAMDRASELERGYPQSVYLPTIQSSLAATLGGLFGNWALPIPQGRVVDMEVCIRGLLSQRPGDPGLVLGFMRSGSRPSHF